MNAKELIDLIQKVSQSMGLDPDLCLAIAGEETNFDNEKTRYEPAWKYLLDPHKYAGHLGITVITESVHQSTSWGCMQVMGSVARELGYNGQLPRLIQPDRGVLYGCLKMRSISDLYDGLEDRISAYNAGSPVKKNGVYNNDDYVQKVMSRFNRLKLV